MSTFPGGFVPVAPPADGLRLAFADARRRRNRKAGATGAAGLLAAVAFLASAGGTGDRTLLQEPVPPASEGGHQVLPGRSAAVPSSTPRAPAVDVVPAADAHPRAGVARDIRSEQPAAGEHSSSGSGGGRSEGTTERPVSGPMQRSTSFLYTGDDLVCPARKQQEHQRGWCTDVYATSNSDGTMTLTAEICNVGTATEVLSFPGERELDLTIRQAERDVWRWSSGRRFAATPHDIPVGAQGCVLWSTTWPRVDSHGAPVRAGTYTVVADLDASEVAGPDRHPSYPITISSQP